MAITRDGVLYNVTAHDLDTAAAECRSVEETVREQLNGLKSYVQSMEDDWRGIASQQFQILMHEYDANAAMLEQALTAIAGGLDGTSHNYVDAEAAAVAAVSSINIPPARLGGLH
ncbi:MULTISPECIES: WXG100 family type VII secretion target [Streptomyces]|uniref:WXG100 family type VII secretion target n=1 Tax=Streptomyces TaxID=1883 RepID=UPI0023DCFA0D|nr:WXG100 family type VII secretion target [Streptomyces sp. FXJ1.172]WEP00617.1 WXG100 family type VII secretion target [Streptomyces sp. FXJ1.172]